MSGLDRAYLIAAIVCLVAAALALLVKSAGLTEDTKTAASGKPSSSAPIN
jgi:hypothetical protein